jgi:hypothetical protein
VLGLLGGLPVAGLGSAAHAQEKKADDSVVTALVGIVKDKEQTVERRMKASEKLGELKVKDEGAVKAVAALLAEVWPVKDDKKAWVIYTMSKGEGATREGYQEVQGRAGRQMELLTSQVETLSKALTAMGAPEAAEPTQRKALQLRSAVVNTENSTPSAITVNLYSLRLKALQFLVSLRTPSAIAAITDVILDDHIGLSAIEALGTLKVTEVIPKLTDLLVKSKSVEQRRAAAVALGAIGSAKGLPALKAAEAVEEDKECLRAIRKSIEMLGSEGK